MSMSIEWDGFTDAHRRGEGGYKTLPQSNSFKQLVLKNTMKHEKGVIFRNIKQDPIGKFSENF